MVDSYMATHEGEFRPPCYNNNTKYFDKETVPSFPDRNNKPPTYNIKDNDRKLGLCFKCHQKGHSIKDCSLNKSNPSSVKSNTINCCKSVSLDKFSEDSLVQNKEEVLSSCIDTDVVIDADKFHVRSYEDVLIDQLPSIPALIDSGAKICCIREKLIQSLHMAPSKLIKLSSLRDSRMC